MTSATPRFNGYRIYTKSGKAIGKDSTRSEIHSPTAETAVARISF